MSQTVDRAMSILSLIAAGPQTIGMLAGHLGVHKSTAWRLVQSLERVGFVSRRPDGLYSLGSGVLAIGSAALESFDIRGVARPHLARLNQVVRHTVHLATLVDRDVIYIDKLEGTSPILMYSRIGKTASLYASGVGKVILAHQPEPGLTQIIESINFQRHTADTIVTARDFRHELQSIREQGYGFDRGEFEGLIQCIAAPIRAADGSVTSSVSVSAPKVLVSLEELKELLPVLLETTRAISHEYGWRE